MVLGLVLGLGLGVGLALGLGLGLLPGLPWGMLASHSAALMARGGGRAVSFRKDALVSTIASMSQSAPGSA